jgi:hypothetical protein
MYEENAPQYRTMEWLKAFDSPVAHEKYEVPLQAWEYQWTRWLNEEQIWNFLRSLSFINKLSPEQKQVRQSSF